MNNNNNDDDEFIPIAEVVTPCTMITVENCILYESNNNNNVIRERTIRIEKCKEACHCLCCCSLIMSIPCIALVIFVIH